MSKKKDIYICTTGTEGRTIRFNSFELSETLSSFVKRRPYICMTTNEGRPALRGSRDPVLICQAPTMKDRRLIVLKIYARDLERTSCKEQK